MDSVEPTVDQLRTFYRVVRQAVLLSSYIAFTELTEDGNLFVYIRRYDEPESNIILFITPDGEVNNEF
jgi:hypothetical protein